MKYRLSSMLSILTVRFLKINFELTNHSTIRFDKNEIFSRRVLFLKIYFIGKIVTSMVLAREVRSPASRRPLMLEDNDVLKLMSIQQLY